jgi:predicted outer membrane repeat protein
MGGGMRNDSNDAPTLTNLTFTANQAYEGGGMYNDFSSPVITNCTFSGNRAADRGGGIYNSGSSPVLINVTFSGNQASMGGGLMNYSSNPTMTGCTFAGNQAGYGGGIANISSYPTLTDCTIAGNSATYEGGGMRNYTSSPVLDNCTFVGNSAGQGGGMYNRYSQQSINDCTFSGNTASMGGGVFTQEGSVIVFTNCTFAGNSAGTGGGIYSYSDSPPVLTNCTFWGNSAQLGGGLYTAKTSYYQPYPGPVVSNSILWANTPDEVAVSDETITPIITFSNVQGGFEGEGNIAADPLFVDTTSADFHLEPDSPCVDSGDNEALHLPEYDYEGDFRILDGDRDWSAIADMGVDELVADAPIPVEVVIDIKPKSLANNLMLSSRGMISVAILTTEAFDASTVDPTTVLFALAAPVRYTMQDVDQDGDLDLLLTFKIQDLILDANSTEASLTGETLEGVPIQGMDMVHIIP